jgi:hypothetical protein
MQVGVKSERLGGCGNELLAAFIRLTPPASETTRAPAETTSDGQTTRGYIRFEAFPNSFELAAETVPQSRRTTC